ncbi:MAG: hypothetical protein MZV49_14635 [Rhodopseudomonas palustris]|nr:hypothetical protein [Rhodopseudomonas palustris]
MVAAARHRRSSSCSAALSDKIGRKPIILAGCLIAALSLLPDLQDDHHATPTRRWNRPSSRSRCRWSPIRLTARVQFNPVGTRVFTALLRHRQARSCRSPR